MSLPPDPERRTGSRFPPVGAAAILMIAAILVVFAVVIVAILI